MRKLFVFFICIIIYGSLFPFTFNFGDNISERWDILFTSFYPFTSLGDLLGNLVLFIPFGYLGIEGLATTRSGKPPYLKVILYSLLLAVPIQFIQVYIPFRSPSFADAYWNEAGTLLGMAFALLIRKYFPKLSLSHAANTPVILALLWLLYLLFPFVPTIDLQEIKNGLKPLLLNPAFRLDDFLVGLSGWLAFAYFTKNVFQLPFLNRFRLPIFALLSLPARLFIVSNSLGLSDVTAVLSAIVLWPFLAKSRLHREQIFALMIAFTIAVYSLGSLDFNLHDPHFSWIPFSGFLEGSLFSNSRTLFFKIFIYGSLIWLVRTGWPDLRLRSFWIFSFILALEIIQIFMTSHNAEITDPLLVLILASIIRIKRQPFMSPEENTTEVIKEARPKKDPGFQGNIVLLLVSIAIITVTMSIVIKLPGIPYNVRELFRLHGLFITIIPFALFVLWFGMSIPLISGQLLRRPDFHIIRFPLLVLGSGIIGFLLLKMSVTEETMGDIVGAPTIYRDVTFRNLWGDFGFNLSLYFSFPAVWNQIEELVRFLALFSPMTFLLCLFYHASNLIKKYDLHGRASQMKLMAISLSLYLIYALPWILLCKYIAFDQANTDNLNELIARDAFFGLGGGGYLYLLIILIALNSVWVSRSHINGMIKAVGIMIAAIAGWYLFKSGLEAEIHKYGQIFSGVDFLLGPDRINKLSEPVLFFRWIILYISCIIILAWGMRFNLRSLFEFRRTPASENQD